MGEQHPDEVIKALKLEQKLLEDRLKDVAMKLRLIIIKESARDVTANRTAYGRRRQVLCLYAIPRLLLY